MYVQYWPRPSAGRGFLATDVWCSNFCSRLSKWVHLVARVKDTAGSPCTLSLVCCPHRRSRMRRRPIKMDLRAAPR
jgi:hypothetical protein